MGKYNNQNYGGGGSAPPTASNNTPDGAPPHTMSYYDEDDDDEDLWALNEDGPPPAGAADGLGDGSTEVNVDPLADDIDLDQQFTEDQLNAQDVMQNAQDQADALNNAGGGLGDSDPWTQDEDEDASITDQAQDINSDVNLMDTLDLSSTTNNVDPLIAELLGEQQQGQEEASTDYIDDPHDASMELLQELLNKGPQDTTADEQRIMDMFAGKSGQGMADLAAQFGAGGMGQGGALLGAGADLQGRLSREANQEIMGVKNDASDRYMRDLMSTLQAGRQERTMGMTETSFGNNQELIEQLLNDGDTSGLVDEDPKDGLDDQYGIPMDQNDPNFVQAVGNAIFGTVKVGQDAIEESLGLSGTEGTTIGNADQLPDNAQYHKEVNGMMVFKTDDDPPEYYYLPVNSPGATASDPNDTGGQ